MVQFNHDLELQGLSRKKQTYKAQLNFSIFIISTKTHKNACSKYVIYTDDGRDSGIIFPKVKSNEILISTGPLEHCA